METQTLPGYAGNKHDHLTRLAKVEGQVRGIARLVDEDRYCYETPSTSSSARPWVPPHRQATAPPRFHAEPLRVGVPT